MPHSGANLAYGPRLALTFAALGIAALWVGCTSQRPAGSANAEIPVAGSQGRATPESDREDAGNKFRWDGGGVILGEVDETAMTVAEFKSALQELHRAGRERSFQNLVKRYPDLSLESLQSMGAAELQDPALAALAAVCDDFLTGGSRYFSEVLQSPPSELGPFLDARSAFWEQLKSGDPAAALKLNLNKHLPKSPPAFLQVEAHRSIAIAEMMTDASSVAVRTLQAAMQLSENTAPYLAGKLRLLQGEFYRHAGNRKAWRESWSAAVGIQASLVSNAGIADPIFWQRAAFARPADMDWPLSIAEHLQPLLHQRGIQIPFGAESSNDAREAVVWAAIGIMHLDRDEGQSAVLCLKKSEALCQDPAAANGLQLYQARGLILASQPGPASSLLIRLINDNPNSAIAGRAQAVLGAIKVQNGAVAQGRNLLQAALQGQHAWPAMEQRLAEADYALTLLMTGEIEPAVAQLQLACATFQSHGEWDQAYQCLWNLARYYELTGQSEAHQQSLQRLAEFEAVGGLGSSPPQP